MASRFFALFEVIATLLDDILVMSEVTAKKIASVLSDDLAVNAETWCIVDALKRSTLRGFRADKIDIEEGRREMGGDHRSRAR